MLVTGWSWPELKATPTWITQRYLLALDVRTKVEQALLENERLKRK